MPGTRCAQAAPLRRLTPPLSTVAWVVLGLLIFLPGTALRAQFTNLYEGFEGAFPGAWSVADTNSSGTTAYWGQVDAAFGGRGTHSGSYKGYCAGTGYAGTTNTPTYQNNMGAYMSQSIDFTGATAAQLAFWSLVPSIETPYDSTRVYVDSTLVWSNSATAAAWTQVLIPLAAYVGGVHTIKFEFDSDLSVFYEGWYLDDLTVTSTYPVVANDNFASARVISGASGSSSGINYGATKEAGEPSHAGNVGGGSVWFQWVAPASGTVTFNSFSSSFDTLLAVYTGTSVNALTSAPSGFPMPPSIAAVNANSPLCAPFCPNGRP